jgi:hypothetical protein
MADTENELPPSMVVHQYSHALAVAKIEANRSSPRKRRSQPENEIDVIKRKCALSNDVCWQTTGIPTVDGKIRGSTKIDYYVKLLKYTKSSNKGALKTSRKFETKHDAEANYFQCRYNEETPASRKLVDKHLACIFNDTSPEKPIMVSTANVVRTTAKPIKKARFSWSSAMSGAPQRRNSLGALPALNPKLPGPFNRHNSVKNHDSNCQYFSACKIFEQWKTTKDRRATSHLAKVVREQGERKRLIADLNDKINRNNWIELLEGTSPGSELELCATPNDALRVMVQAKALCRAFKILHDSVANNEHKTWQACCDQVAVEQKTKTGRTIMQWSRDFLSGPRHDDMAACHPHHFCGNNDDEHDHADLTTERFPWSKQGRSKNCKMMSPLHPEDNGGDEELTSIFKQWARENLETLSVKRATEKLNDMLGEWTKNQLKHLNITLPLKPWTVSGWMGTAGFVYSVYEKKYFVHTHEKPDVILHRKAYVRDALDAEIQKACWIQLPLTDAQRLFGDFRPPCDDDIDDVH